MVDVYLGCNEEFRKEAKYIFAIIFEILGIPYNVYHSLTHHTEGQKIIINYGSSFDFSKFSNGFLINISCFDYVSFLKLKREPKVGFICSHDTNEKLAYFFANNLKKLKRSWFQDTGTGESLITYHDAQINCSVDIISSAYHLLSLQNEECIEKRDAFGRFQREFCIDSDLVYDYPILDAYCQLLFFFLRKSSEYLSFPIVQKSIWPDGYKFALCLTHDIDRFNTWTLRKVLRNIEYYLRNKYFTNIKLFISRLFRLLRSIINRNNWMGNFELIAKEEKKYDYHSSFYFVAQKHDPLDPSYKLDSPTLRERLKFLDRKGIEIGLHGSLASADSSNYLNQEKILLQEAINKNVYGGRQHFLRFRYPHTFYNIEQASLRYDSTLGFATDLGYRVGVSFPYKPFNRKEKKAYDFYEIPLVIMDTALIKNEKLHVLEGEIFKNTFKKIENFLEKAYQYNGCLTILWHNSEFDPLDVTGYTKMYKDILKWTYEKRGWGCSGYELWSWWHNRASFDFNYKVSMNSIIEISAHHIETETIFINIYFPILKKEFSIDCENCSVNSSYRDDVLNLKVENIKANSIQLKIRSL